MTFGEVGDLFKNRQLATGSVTYTRFMKSHSTFMAYAPEKGFSVSCCVLSCCSWGIVHLLTVKHVEDRDE